MIKAKPIPNSHRGAFFGRSGNHFLVAGPCSCSRHPYDIEAGLAAKLFANYDSALTPEEQKAYDYAMAN